MLVAAAGGGDGGPVAGPDDDLNRVRDLLLRAVRRQCPAWLAAEAEDIVQSALTRALDARRTRREAGGAGEDLPVGYLVRTAQNALIDEIRRKFRRAEVALDSAVDLAPARNRDGDPEHALRARAIDRGLRDCLGRLAGSRRAAVTLHLLGHSASEAVALLAQTRKSVEHLTYRGLADLRSCLEGKGLTP